jgi:Kdo2-lipid IVA lauroyltransferase/acyltransferase
MKRIGFYLGYGFIWTFTLLPLRLLYLFSDFFYLIIYYVAGYRKAVVKDNLRHAFPEKSAAEINDLSRRFFKHFCDFLIESAKTIHLSKREIDRRFRYINPELFQKYYDEGKSVVLVLGHYANWEWVVHCTSVLKHQPLAIYKPLSSEKFDELIRSIRTKWQMGTVPMNDVFRVILQKEKEKVKILTSYLVDQTPPRSYPFWLRFMNRETPFYNGPAKIARKFDHPVVYMKIRKIRRGFYETEFFPLFDEPGKFSEQEIMLRIVAELEDTIRQQPEYWLWSHRRWKHTKENPTPTNN